MNREQWVSITDEEFISYAGTDATRWQTLVGSRIVHPRYGEGTIVTVKGRGDRNTVIEISFDDGVGCKLFGLAVIGICKEIQVPSHRATHFKRPSKTIHAAAPETKRPQPKFRQGQQVVLVTDPKQKGFIAKEPFWGSTEWQYEVFFSAQRVRFHRESDLAKPTASVQWIGFEELLRNLALVKLRQPMSDGLYAIYGSRTQFEVYQFKPALKFLGNPDQRLLIADEVGLGKTIEAGIIYLELQARLDLKRVLIVCPSKLRQKWQSELQFRFDEEFTILDAAGMRRFIQQYTQYGAHTRLRGIVSLELIRREEFAKAIVNLRLAFDLVVIDEAHYCRNTGTLSNNIANILSENADAMLLLTATPLQTGNEDLFNLLHILAPGEFDNYEAFLERLEPNQFVNRAARMLAAGEANKARHELRKVEQTRARQRFISNPYYGQTLKTLARPFLSREQQIKAQRRLVDLNTLANIFTRTRKREIAEKVPLRQASTLMVRFSPAEAAFYQRVIEHVREQFARLHGRNFVAGWVTIMHERQAASSIAAARERFAEIAREVNWSTEETDLLDTAVVGEVEDEELKEIQESLQKRQWYQRMAAMRFEGFVDSKFNIFWQTLRQVLNETPQSKVLVFSFFRDTITYLQRQLRKQGVGTEVLHGGIPVVDRPKIIDRFREDETIRVLISSEVGAEGLDFQFCDTLFNYDLPWNPMRVEQRIGRIDRFGQQADKIRIFNLVIDNSIESRILIRLYERIGLFEQAVGDIEAILGEEIRELSRRVYTSRLTPAEEERLAEQAANNIVRRQQDMEEFEKRQLEFMGQEAIFSTLVNETIASGHYISDREVYGLVHTFIREAFPRTHLERNEPYDGTYVLEIGHDSATPN